MNWHTIYTGPQVSLEDMLACRESRLCRQRELLAKGGQCLISFSLNIAGNIKQFPMAQYALESGLQELRMVLPHPPLEEQIIHQDTGSEALLLLIDPPDSIKNITISLEESHSVGRLFDLDVLDKTAQPLSRTTFGAAPRPCMICGKNSKVCARSEAHSLKAIRQETVRILEQYNMNRGADQVSFHAIRALLYEVSVTPKPGLVDRNNSGAHSDMDFFTFLDSSAALAPWFRELYCIGYRNHEMESAPLFHKLRFAGQQAEAAMFAATGGINTHKGAIFSLGLLCGAMGKLYAKTNAHVSTEQVLVLCSQMACESVNKMERDTSKPYHTTGEQLYLNYGILGARGEAKFGFPSVKNIALPTLRECLQKGFSLNDAAVCTLIALMAQVVDTNLIHRSSIETAKKCRSHAASIFSDLSAETFVSQIEELDQQYIRQHLSPGGCADLLMLSLMIYFCQESGLLIQN